MNTVGREAAVAIFRGRFEVLGPSNHVTHDRIKTFDDTDPDQATGQVLAHAEMNRKNQPMLAAIRFEDAYQRHEGRWKVRRRSLSFFHVLPADRGVSRSIRPRDRQAQARLRHRGRRPTPPVINITRLDTAWNGPGRHVRPRDPQLPQTSSSSQSVTWHKVGECTLFTLRSERAAEPRLTGSAC